MRTLLWGIMLACIWLVTVPGLERWARAVIALDACVLAWMLGARYRWMR